MQAHLTILTQQWLDGSCNGEIDVGDAKYNNLMGKWGQAR
jgi:hypothetical protein